MFDVPKQVTRQIDNMDSEIQEEGGSGGFVEVMFGGVIDGKGVEITWIESLDLIPFSIVGYRISFLECSHTQQTCFLCYAANFQCCRR